MNNKSIIILVLSLISLLYLNSCNLFSLRNPEQPDNGNVSFQPPTSPTIVISNLTNAIIEKNAENYISCLTDSSATISNFNFLPSANATSSFIGTFDNWTTFSEKTYYLSMISNMESFNKPEILFTNVKLDLFSDSAIYTSNYLINIEHKVSNFPKSFQGNLRFTIVQNNSGLWYIKRWYDYSNNDEIADSLKYTWSFIKGRFFN